MAISDKLNKIINTKEDIRQAINEQGIIVDASEVFANYGDKIREVEGSTESYEGVLTRQADDTFRGEVLSFEPDIFVFRNTAPSAGYFSGIGYNVRYFYGGLGFCIVTDRSSGNLTISTTSPLAIPNQINMKFGVAPNANYTVLEYTAWKF